MAVHMETTKIAPEKTIMEIQKLLASAGAKKIMTDYDGSGEPVGLVFSIQYEDQELPYKLPVKTDWLFKYFQANRTYSKDKVKKDLAQAKRTAWRIIYRWLQAQLALVSEANMVDIKEVFLPYHWNGEKTYYEAFAEEHGIKMLEDRT